MSYEPWPGQDDDRERAAGLPGWGPPSEGAWAGPGHRDPWAAPPRQTGPGGPGSPGGPRHPQWLVPLVVVVAVAVAMVGAAVLLTRGGETRRPVAAPQVTAPPSVRPTPKPKPKPTRKATAKPKPVATRTYSAPPDGVPITGRVVDVNGRPVAGAKVTLTRHEGIIEGLGRALGAVFSLGLICLAEDACTVPYGQGITNARGDYTVFLKPEVDDYDIDVEARGALVESRIDFTGAPLKLPTVKLWSPTPRLEIRGGTASVVFAGPPASLGPAERYNAVVTDRRSGTELVVVRNVGSRDTFDARRLEDAPVRLRLSGLIHTGLGDTWYTGHYEAQGRLRPPSRGKGCVEYGPGKRVARNTAACRRVTDGSFGTAWDPAPAPCPTNTTCDQLVGVDLGGVRRVRYVNVPGCGSFDEIEFSTDGRKWTSVENGDDDGCGLDTDVRARYVRLNTPFAEQTTEISVWY